MDCRKCADMLLEAEQTRRPIGRLTDIYPEMTVAEAYDVQLANVRRKEAAGQRMIGFKIGLTSAAMQKVLNVHEPAYGYLFADMMVPEGQAIDTGKLIAPKVEGELSFVLDKPLKGPGLTIADVYAATKYVVPSIEIVDSRVKNWDVKLQDMISDNGSAAGIILGSHMTPIGQVDMQLTGMNMLKNGRLVHSGTTAEVLGNPAYAVAVFANMLGQLGQEIPAGSIIMSGALTQAVPVQAGDTITVAFHGMGQITVPVI